MNRSQITICLDGRILESHPVQLRLPHAGGCSPATLSDIAVETPAGIVF